MDIYVYYRLTTCTLFQAFYYFNSDKTSQKLRDIKIFEYFTVTVQAQ